MTLLLKQLEASHENTGHGVWFFADETCTNSVNADVPGLNLSRTGW